MHQVTHMQTSVATKKTKQWISCESEQLITATKQPIGCLRTTTQPITFKNCFQSINQSADSWQFSLPLNSPIDEPRLCLQVNNATQSTLLRHSISVRHSLQWSCNAFIQHESQEANEQTSSSSSSMKWWSDIGSDRGNIRSLPSTDQTSIIHQNWLSPRLYQSHAKSARFIKLIETQLSYAEIWQLSLSARGWK